MLIHLAVLIVLAVYTMSLAGDLEPTELIAAMPAVEDPIDDIQLKLQPQKLDWEDPIPPAAAAMRTPEIEMQPVGILFIEIDTLSDFEPRTVRDPRNAQALTGPRPDGLDHEHFTFPATH